MTARQAPLASRVLAPARQAAVDRLKRLDAVREWRDRVHYRRFLSEFASVYGVFGDFDEARRRLPPSREFDQAELTDEYVQVRCHRIFNYDYPVLYWLSTAFGHGARSVFDLGGSVGVHYFGYRRVLDYPDGLRWIVSEVPEVCEVGRRIAAQESAPSLEFADTLEPSHIDADVWLSAGALQYVEHGQPGRLLAGCARRPVHIVLNKLPLYDGAPFVTAQNLGEHSYAPMHVYNASEFIAGIERFGYRLVDRWQVPERSLYLPGHPDRSFKTFTGLYFRAA